MKNKYAVGDRWVAVDSRGNRGEVWLSDIVGRGTELWRWSWQRSDGSGWKSDWCPSKRSAVNECRLRFYGAIVKFKRVKEVRTIT